ncbi:MAG: MBL fold metallo-hydrolase [Phycisphaerae bacterium]|nr:MBL fold metallo-hydrolase [Phycisphaerae bacterium]
MSVEITWLGHASFRLASPGCVLYIDPWKITGQPHDADVVFVSHSHYDHCSPPDVQHVGKDGTEILAPPDAADSLASARVIAPGETIRLSGATIEPTPAYNLRKPFHPKANGWCGAVFTLGGVRVYYAGDTDRIPEMDHLKNVDVALLPVGGTYTLNAAEAAEVCKAIGSPKAIPYHWGDIVGKLSDAQAFADAVGDAAHVLQPGETITV